MLSLAWPSWILWPGREMEYIGVAGRGGRLLRGSQTRVSAQLSR